MKFDHKMANSQQFENYFAPPKNSKRGRKLESSPDLKHYIGSNTKNKTQ